MRGTHLDDARNLRDNDSLLGESVAKVPIPNNDSHRRNIIELRSFIGLYRRGRGKSIDRRLGFSVKFQVEFSRGKEMEILEIGIDF